MGKIEEKKRQKKETLLHSAYELFTEKGINNTSISDIVKRAKMAKGTFYLYFKDKYEIRDHLITKQAGVLFEKAGTAIADQSWDSLEERIMALVNNVIDQLAENPSLMRFISKNLSWAIFSHIRLEQYDNRDCMEIFEGILRKSGRKFRDQDLMIFMIVEIVNATCYNVILAEQPVTMERLKPELQTAICSIIKQFEV